MDYVFFPALGAGSRKIRGDCITSSVFQVRMIPDLARSVFSCVCPMRPLVFVFAVALMVRILEAQFFLFCSGA